LALDLADDAELIREYRRMHEPGSVWPAVIEHIRVRGVIAMEIWQRGNRLFMVMEAADDYPRPDASEARLAQNSKWETLMATFQRALPDHVPGEKWSPMNCIFRLSDHAGESNS
jgi:L-rhamnose mutarotase